MTTQQEKQEEKQPVSVIVVVAAIVVMIAVLVGFGRHYFASQSPSLAQQLDLDKHPIPAWIIQDAQQCKGDISALDPQERQKIQGAYPGQGARIIVAAAYATQH